jgi:hypothetical protein
MPYCLKVTFSQSWTFHILVSFISRNGWISPGDSKMKTQRMKMTRKMEIMTKAKKAGRPDSERKLPGVRSFGIF